MEETLKLILLELKGLKDGQQRLEAGMERLEVRMDNLEVRMDNLETRMNNLEVRMDSLEAKVGELDTELREVKRLVWGTFEQVGMLTEFRTETIATLSRHENMIGKLA